MLTFRTIVAAIDFSDSSVDVLDAATELARESNGRLHLLNVVPDPWHQAWSAEAAGVDLVGVQMQWIEQAKVRLQALRLDDRLDPNAVIHVVRTGWAHDEIVRYANEQKADVIVMGTHGYGPVKRFLLGSVADRVIRQASCPVLAVPHRDLRGEASPVEAAAAQSA